MDFTKAQLQAIDAEKDNILVCAAAGSGKTTVLCNRIAKRIAMGECDISKILVVTFTIASADDLKRKLRETLNEACAKAVDKQTKRYIQKQLSLLPKARISTIHSFALEMIRQNFDKLALPAKIRVADEWESQLLASRVMDTVIEEMYKNDADGSFAEFTDLLITDRDGELGGYFLEIYSKLSNEIKGIDLILENIEEIKGGINRDFFQTPWGRVLKENARLKLDYCVKYLKQAAEGYTEDSPAYKFYGTRFLQIYKCAEAIRSCLDLGLNEFIDCLKSIELANFKGNAGAKANEAKIENHSHYMDVFYFLKELIENNGKKLGFQFALDTVKEDMSKTAEHLKSLYSLLSAFDERFAEEKKKRGVVDFTDIERMTHSLLLDEMGNRTELAVKYTKEFYELYIDEYQDTNKVQDDIFRAISNGNMFIVGDIKQSIYGFRGACPEIFSKYRREGFGDGSGQRVFLSENFRSDPNIVDFSNGVFSNIMKDVSTVGYKTEDNLKFSKSKNIKDQKTELYLFKDVKNEEHCSQAEFVASYIKDELNRGTPAEDIAVLCRSMVGSSVSELVDSCKRYGVPITMGDGDEFFKKPWVLLLLCLINTIDNKTKDIYVTGALKGELFGFTLDMLTRVRIEYPSQLGMWYSLDSYVRAHEEKGELDEITVYGRRFFSFIEKMREVEASSSVDELIRTVIYSSRIIEALSLGQSGERGDEIRSDILKVYSYAVDFASRSSMGLSSFIAHLKGIMENDSGNKKKNSQKGAVRLMTIHGSKGLQFPICILYNAEKSFKLTADKDCPIIFGGELGFAFRLKGERVEDKHDTLLTAAVKQKYVMEQREEEMRLLYVAFTRAENRLVITGKSSLDMNDAPPFDVEHAMVMSASSYLDWLYLCMEHIDSNTYTVDVNPPLRAELNGDDIASLTSDVISELTADEEERLKNVYSEYSYSKLSSLPAKVSVSELSPEFLDLASDIDREILSVSDVKDKKEIKLPEFMGGRVENIGARKGTATHLFMQFCDFDLCQSCGVEKEIDRLVENGFIDPETASLISIEKVEGFFKSSLYKRIKEGGRVLREQRFNIKLEASRFTMNPDKKKELDGEELLVQGVVDCVFFDKDGTMVLVDYKTDGFNPKTKREEVIKILKERYENQLFYYLLALDNIFPGVKKKACIYSFFLNCDFLLDIEINGEQQ